MQLDNDFPIYQKSSYSSLSAIFIHLFYNIAICIKNCKNGGVCVKSATDGNIVEDEWYCNCVDGYFGENCEGNTRDHSFSEHTKFSWKTLFLTPWYVHVRVRVRREEMLFFSENFTYVLNEWFPAGMHFHKNFKPRDSNFIHTSPFKKIVFILLNIFMFKLPLAETIKWSRTKRLKSIRPKIKLNATTGRWPS